MMPRCFLTALILCLSIPTGFADELKPAYAELTELSKNQWRLVWKVSERSTLGQIGQLVVPDSCVEIEPINTRRELGNLIRTSRLDCSTEIWEQRFAIKGLEKSNTDALIRVASLEGLQTIRLEPDQVSAVIPKPHSTIISNVGTTYAILGVEHILQGYDHLLFVIAMVLLVSGFKRIVWTVTAFTVAHSITLIGTTFGYFALPQKPVEAIIALSIVFLALEILKRQAGQLRLSEAYPWLVAFSFGLLHGFGFAGALAEIGLPETDVPLALLTFNLGVELGQLAVVALTLCILYCLKKLVPLASEPVKICCAYFIGITSTYWLIERVLS